MIYLDHAATTMPKPREVTDAVVNAMNYFGSLGRSSHEAAVQASETAYTCRELAATLFDAAPDQVVFTFNATHGLNIAIHSLVERGDKVVVSGFEHNAVMRPLHKIGARIIIAGRKLFDVQDTIHAFRAAVDSTVKAVICTHVSNAFGYVLPIKEIAAICAEKGVPLIIDAAQSAGIIPLSFRQLGAAFIAMPGHKGLLGPQGTGLLLCAVQGKPLLQGGTGTLSRSKEMPEFLPERLEAGTQNIHGIAGLSAGLCYISSRDAASVFRHEQKLINSLSASLDRNKYQVFSSLRNDQSGVLSIIPHHMECEEFGQLLSANGFAVRTGLHCAPIAHESADTLKTGTVRISVGVLTAEDEVAKFSDFCNALNFS